MCQSIAEGGDRCAAHSREDHARADAALGSAREAYDRAQAAMRGLRYGTPEYDAAQADMRQATAVLLDAQDAEVNAFVEYAMTPGGRADVEARRAAAGSHDKERRFRAVLATADDKNQFVHAARDAAASPADPAGPFEPKVRRPDQMQYQQAGNGYLVRAGGHSVGSVGKDSSGRWTARSVHDDAPDGAGFPSRHKAASRLADMHEERLPALRAKARAEQDRRMVGCRSCMGKETFQPSHDGSPRCQSGSLAAGGRKAHCSCDTCF